jgi:hypothetical protein
LKYYNMIFQAPLLWPLLLGSQIGACAAFMLEVVRCQGRLDTGGVEKSRVK